VVIVPQIKITSPRFSWRRAAVFTATLTAAALITAILVRPTQDAVANGETRALNLVNMHTGEKINIVYKRGGRYDSEALKKLNYFLRDWRRDEPTRMDPRVFDTVWLAYQAVGGREPIHVVSAYRSPETNASLRRRSRGVAKFSQHTLGKAMDFYVPGVKLADLRAAGLRLQRGGVGFYPTSGSPFVHMDAGSVRMWPRMSRAQLAAVFPDGKTVHIPSDGKPMPGYQAAFAALKRDGGSFGGFQGRAADDEATESGGFSIAGLFSGGSSSRKGADSPQAVLLADAARRSGTTPATARETEGARPRPETAKPAAAPVQMAALEPVAVGSQPAPIPAPAAEKAAAKAPKIDVPLPERRPADLQPQMVWQTGPAALATADVPLPPSRPGEAAPVTVAAAASVPDETAATQPIVKPRLPVMAGIAGGMEQLLPRQLRNSGSGSALGYAPSSVPEAVLQPRSAPVALVATRFEALDFATVSAPVASARNPAHATFTAPDLDTFATLIPKPSKLVVMRFGVAAYQDLRAESFSGAAIKPLRTASFVVSPRVFSQATGALAN
jgi:uncharacterized protein YcbK (DUF882 family)